MASRGRKYIVGLGGGAPLLLSVSDISAVLDAHPSPLRREEIDACIFALDAEFMELLDEKPKPQADVGSAWGGVVAAVNAGV